MYYLHFSNQAAGPVFAAAADFQDQINSGLYVTGTQALKFMTVLVSIMIPYSQGFHYQHSCATDDAAKSGLPCVKQSLTHTVTHYFLFIMWLPGTRTIGYLPCAMFANLSG